MDLLALLPFDYFVVWIATRHGGGMSDTALNYFQLFRLLRMVGRKPDVVSPLWLGFPCCPTGRRGSQLTHLAAVMQLRMYRVPQFFLDLEYKLNVSLLGVTLVRNFVFL